MSRGFGIFLALLLASATLTTTSASAYNYGWDPLKNQGDLAYMELAQNPTQIASGIYQGKYEYFFDLYIMAGSSFYWTSIVGLDNDKIANSQTITPDGDHFKTQEYYDPDGYGNRAAWADSTGRILDFWSKTLNVDAAGASTPNRWRTSYDDTNGGWTDAGLAWYDGSSVNNPHAHSEYIHYDGWGTDLWKAELLEPGGALPWELYSEGASPAEEMILIQGTNYGFFTTVGYGGLVSTLRVVYDEPIDPETFGWGKGLSADYPVLGDFNVELLPACDGIAGDANCDGYVDIANDIFAAFGNFTGPGSYGMTRLQGDVQGNPQGATTNLDPHDGDVDVSDIITMFSNFTGPKPPEDQAGGLVAAEALDSTIPDLIYDAATGEVLLDLDSAVGFTGYVLNSANGFITGNHTPFMAGVTTTLPYELAEATFGTPAGPYPKSIGNVFPSGMDMAALSAFLTGNQVSRGNNQPIVPFDLVIVNPVSSGVPEPAAVVMGIMALAGLASVAYRRRRA